MKFYKLPNKKDQAYQLWQEGSHPQQIETDDVIEQKIASIHDNPLRRGPLRRGYVDETTHWRYSSARCYAGQPGLMEVCTDRR